MNATDYAEALTTQLRKGFLSYCVLVVCAKEPRYTSEIIQQLRQADLMVVEGTIYPLLSRLQKEWKESEQGPPRKYYTATSFGAEVTKQLKHNIAALSSTIEKL